MKAEQFFRNLIKQGSDQQLELMEEVHYDQLAKTLCAFLNSKGGSILVGVEDNGKIVGLKDPEMQESMLKQFLFKSIIPVTPITVSTEEIGNKTILLVKVWPGTTPPYLYEGIIYTRNGSLTEKAVPDDISKLVIERQKTETHWERQLSTETGIEAMDEWEIRKTIRDLNSYGRGKAFSEKQPEDFLAYYGLYYNNRCTNAALVLFANEPCRYLPQCRIRLTVFESSKSSDNFVYDRVLEGNLFRNIEEILLFFDVNIANKSRFSEKSWLREDLVFPKAALREGLMNALIHRDYTSISGSVMVAFYPDRLEISNSGELYGGYTPADFSRTHLSVPRNPDIAHICFIRQMIEKIGRGTLKMIEDCENKGYPMPIWISKSGVTKLYFPAVTITAKTDETANNTLDDISIEAIGECFTGSVKKRLIAIVSFVRRHKHTKVTDLMKEFNVSERTIKSNLKKLIDAGLIVYIGSKKTGAYSVIIKTTDNIQP